MSGDCVNLSIPFFVPQLVSHKVPGECVKSGDIVNPVSDKRVKVQLEVVSCNVNELGGDLPVPRLNVICGDYLNDVSDEIFPT